MKESNPDYGIKRIWTFLKEDKGWEVSEKRVKKCMQDNNLTSVEAGGVEADGGGEADDKKKIANVSNSALLLKNHTFVRWSCICLTFAEM